MAMRPPLSVKIIYSIGQLGWSLASFGVATLIPYFYMPPEKGEEVIFPTFIFQGAILGILTVAGLILAGGRLFDAITDPLIANFSDKNESKFGKRKILLAISAVPMAICSFLVFYPISDTNLALNTAWMMGMVFLFYLFFTMYVVPYNALISELGHVAEDRMLISTIISVTWAVGFALGNLIHLLKAHFIQTMPPTEAFQLSLGILTCIALVCMLVPVFFLNEKKYTKQEQNAVPIFKSIRTVWSDRNFRLFTFSDLMYWLSITIIQLGLVYYIPILLGMEESAVAIFMPVTFLASFLFYAPINIYSKKHGKKNIVLAGFIVLGLAFVLISIAGFLPYPNLQMALMIICSAPALAIFGIIPNAIVADLINQRMDLAEENHAGMYYAVRTFMMKIGITLGSVVFTSLLLLGKGQGNDFGIRATGIVAIIFCVMGMILFSRYQDVVEVKKKE